jgi:hypothetical protein
MISKEVETVNDTKIFCGLNSNRTRQITVYANTVNNISDNNAMVLPVPFPESVEFHDLSNYKKFFDDCEDCFYLPQTKSFGSRGMMLTNSYVDSYEAKTLKVFNVGSYKVSLAKNLSDLKRVNKNVFDLSSGLESILRQYYSNSHFGFIICKLVRGNESYHPFAYSHKIFNSKVFIPTKHYHDESQTYFNQGMNTMGLFADVQGWINPNQNKRKSYDDSYADDWGHDIYLYNVDINSNQEAKKMNTSKYLWDGENKIKFSKLDFDLDRNCRNFQKVQINGSNPNIDLILYSS